MVYKTTKFVLIFDRYVSSQIWSRHHRKTPRNSGIHISYLVEHILVCHLLNFRFPDAEKLSPPLLQLSNVTFGYTEDRFVLKDVDIDVGADSRIAVVGELFTLFSAFVAEDDRVARC